MAIPINGINSGPTGNSRSRNIDQNVSAPQTDRQNIDKNSTSTAEISKGENVSLSTQALTLKKVEQDLKNQPEVNKSRVAELKSQIENGTYQIDNQKLAHNMLNLEGTLF
jgi:negative regulator of flagellin synthesis FlgM